MSDTSNTVAFVRTETIPQMPPPAAETGAIKWMRENLFASIPNAILTLVSAYVIYSILAGVLPWIFNGVWNAQTLAECREILDGTSGACFAVLTERWPQLVFGLSYPASEYWRPSLAFVLLFFAAAPVMFFDLPRKMLIITLFYPFITYWLLWGGTVLIPILAFAGFVAGYLVYQRFVAGSFAAGFFGGVIAAMIVWYIGGFLIPDGANQNAMLRPVASRDMGGFMLNMMLGVTCVSLSIPIGIVLALGRQSSMPLIKWICVVFIEFIRGVPLITLLFVASVMLAYFFPPESSVDLFLRVVIMITMFSAAYIAEVIRGGLAALPKGQYEAADSLGLDYAQAMRLIILPQALKISIPGIVNIAVGLFKDTTLVSVISMFDIVGMIRGPILSSTDWNGVYWELLGFAALLFFVTCYGISQYSQWLERRLATDHR
ncbi:L-glutamine ABC transporter membrane protein /L-glutamate ABC transporter membrane protein /L-aspartate ABC transporter membrane protein /L-asparagine ABC transporter membrane protein [Yoonia maricola]|uniref:L-glutamine ABC transporter membrane protein /L-glutamate ABC transporter membrane protein /L-aspartate ABC transporter membrane protein /L-asparagine ABC transporter membrane protein n=1 Tax=Yoonia maricola TaxID=420999 RepID=A0A2M8WQF2_9RHOB|nr:amino acid ABC transporter permease [Yoonia maricola]PJI93165.1 L-glutamine ABC transporter membrane protein /L-glutamate ABC transporter membrane protein /L-aspartate ABC transporter membrane protein /L-asparagine ABC transporter membrane protein [Yoonia maricola]